MKKKTRETNWSSISPACNTALTWLKLDVPPRPPVPLAVVSVENNLIESA